MLCVIYVKCLSTRLKSRHWCHWRHRSHWRHRHHIK
nr:MAG TPA: hypothetical protein [Caudoviricetes sp.]